MIVLISSITYAQKGSWYIGGVAGYGTNTRNQPMEQSRPPVPGLSVPR
jgi:hypothetical protein